MCTKMKFIVKNQWNFFFLFSQKWKVLFFFHFFGESSLSWLILVQNCYFWFNKVYFYLFKLLTNLTILWLIKLLRNRCKLQWKKWNLQMNKLIWIIKGWKSIGKLIEEHILKSQAIELPWDRKRSNNLFNLQHKNQFYQ